jgi:hypothetical protein
MLNITNSVVGVTGLKKVTDKLTTGTIYSGYKVNKDEWDNVFIDCKFVGEAIKDAKKLKLKDKTKFVIESATIGAEKWEKDGKNYSKPVITIFKISKYEPTDYDTPKDDGDMPF